MKWCSGGVRSAESGVARDGFEFERDTLKAFKEVELVRWESRSLCEVCYEKSMRRVWRWLTRLYVSERRRFSSLPED